MGGYIIINYLKTLKLGHQLLLQVCHKGCIIYLSKGIFISDVVHQNSPIRVSVVYRPKGMKFFLSSSVPYSQVDTLAIYINLLVQECCLK